MKTDLKDAFIIYNTMNRVHNPHLTYH